MTPNSPMPPPDGVACPHCGATQSTSVAYCANCGAPLPPVKGGGSLSLLVKIVVAILLFLGALGVGALGACVLVIGGMSNGADASSAAAGASVFFVIAALLAVMGVAWSAFCLMKKR